jgi:hypothetical protein
MDFLAGTTGLLNGHRPRCTTLSVAMRPRWFRLSSCVSADLDGSWSKPPRDQTEFLLGTVQHRRPDGRRHRDVCGGRQTVHRRRVW